MDKDTCAEEEVAFQPKLRSTPRRGSKMVALPAASASNEEPSTPTANPSLGASDGLPSADPKSCKVKRRVGHGRKPRRRNKPEADAAQTPLRLREEQEEHPGMAQVGEREREIEGASPGI